MSLPPAGAMVTDADGTRWVYPTWRNEDEAPLCLALWRMQQERDQLKARVAELEGTLVGIRDANWRAWWGGSTADDFVEWAKSRARHVLGEVTVSASYPPNAWHNPPAGGA